ncbi:hypothetical protein [Rhizobium paknamense]|uniref:Uncharacterized protein n=1 Tax=Rhizobium paknamense TaxID=1206817 RepID=A0ABU0IIK1_9HYPH|nr:hypothetical protein [Rhizobium paknamense]MDQ0458088.1 hypothetical protein [Rhizobium paknamense]
MQAKICIELSVVTREFLKKKFSQRRNYILVIIIFFIFEYDKKPPLCGFFRYVIDHESLNLFQNNDKAGGKSFRKKDFIARRCGLRCMCEMKFAATHSKNTVFSVKKAAAGSHKSHGNKDHRKLKSTDVAHDASIAFFTGRSQPLQTKNAPTDSVGALD